MQGIHGTFFQKHASAVALDFNMPEPTTDADLQHLLEELCDKKSFRNEEGGLKACRWFSIMSPTKTYDEAWSANHMLLEHWWKFVAEKTDDELHRMMEGTTAITEECAASKSTRELVQKLRGQGGGQLVAGLAPAQCETQVRHADHCLRLRQAVFSPQQATD